MNRKNSIAGSISGLLFGGGPFAIHRPTVCDTLLTCTTGIATLRVNSVDGFIRRTFSHIGKEFRKRFSPSITHKHPTRSVVIVFFMFGIIASLFSETPTGVCPITFSHFPRPVSVGPFQNRIGCLEPFGTQLILPASARDSKVISDGSGQFGLCDYFGGSTLAYTKPEPTPNTAHVASFGFFNNCELSNSLSEDYDRFSHGILAFDFNAVISRASATTEVPAILPNLTSQSTSFGVWCGLNTTLGIEWFRCQAFSKAIYG